MTFSYKCARALSIARLVALSVFALLPGGANADSEPKIEITLSRPQITLGEGTSLIVTLSGTGGSSEPILPQIAEVDIVLQGRTQSVQIINMEVNTSRIFRYAVMPHKTGEFTLGPAEIKRNGQTYKSNVVQLSVTGAASQDRQPNAAETRNVIVEVSVDNAKPYVGQQINLILHLARKAGARIGNADFKLPDLPGFWNENMESRREYTQRVGNADYMVTEVAIPLFPMKEGDTTVGPITIGYDEVVQSGSSPFESPFFNDPFGKSPFDDDFFKLFKPEQIVKRAVSTRPIQIRARPLPLEGRPEAFKSGVGSFSLNTRLSSKEVKAGESATLTVTVSGEGNIRDITDPKLNIEGVKAYSDTPSVNVKNYRENVVGEKVYKLALVPQYAGDVVIPKLSVPYFNPKTGRYELATSAALTLKVLPSEEETVASQASETPRARERADSTRHDILPIHERIGSIESDRLVLWLSRLRLLVYPLPLAAYALCFAIVRRRERLRTDTAFRRYKFALKTAEAHMEKAREAAQRQKWDEVFTECSRALAEYLADRLDVPAAGLTAADICAALSSRNVREELTAEIVKFLEGCDYGRFASAGRGAGLADEYLKETDRLIGLLQEEETLRR
ncbi:protein BatD [Candidatus Poribacteria bacterium]|nr:protein BatD [Candidatus Poribacteria bacterium]